MEKREFFCVKYIIVFSKSKVNNTKKKDISKTAYAG
jgi:hypothetical protein